MTANKIPNVVPDATERQAPATEPQTVPRDDGASSAGARSLQPDQSSA